MENQLPTFADVRKALKPWLNEKTNWSGKALKLFRTKKNITVVVCYSIIYDKTHKQRYIFNEVEKILTNAGFTHNGLGTFKREENLVD